VHRKHPVSLGLLVQDIPKVSQQSPPSVLVPRGQRVQRVRGKDRLWAAWGQVWIPGREEGKKYEKNLLFKCLFPLIRSAQHFWGSRGHLEMCLALLKINRKRGHSSKCNGKGVCLHLPAASQQEVLGGGTSLITAVYQDYKLWAKSELSPALCFANTEFKSSQCNLCQLRKW
jgi:hypothetical protein